MSYTLKQAGDLTGLSTKTLRRKIASGELAATKQKGKYGDEYIIETIPSDLLIKASSSGQPLAQTTGQEVGDIPIAATVPPPPETAGQNHEQTTGQTIEPHTDQSPPQAIEHIPRQAAGQPSGQESRQGLNSDTTFHELMKLVRKLQEENASLHEKIGELNATIQMLSSGRMLPMTMPFANTQPGKSWWGKLAFWKR